MNKQILRLWIIEKLDGLTSTLTNLEQHLSHGMQLMDEKRIIEKCNQIRGEEKILKELYYDFNLEDAPEEKIHY
jgi:hypothetical protein